VTKPITSQQEVLSYFRGKAARYDLVDNQLYWQLSDTLLWRALQDTALDKAPDGFRFLDAGGGTGRWTQRILDAYPDSSGVLYDLSADMAAEAERKLSAEIESGRLRTTIADLTTASEIEGSAVFDLVICLHNVVGFVSDPLTVIAELAETLAPGGRLAIFAPNKYHVAYFNLSRGEVEMARQAMAGRGRFTNDMPEMALFTTDVLAELCELAQLKVEVRTGFPVLLYPGYEETRIVGTSSIPANVLADPVAFDQVLALEQQALAESSVSARGNNLYLVARKD
jgi:SAM-dependent methyltransferase